MKIDRKTIEQTLDYFEKKQFSDKSEKEILKKFPDIMSYLTSNQFNVLSDDEYLILSFNILLILKIYLDSENSIPAISSELIELNETKNWERLEKTGNIPFEEKAIQLFGDENKDLADFIISTFYDEDDTAAINIPALEIILIAVKTVFDCFD